MLPGATLVAESPGVDPAEQQQLGQLERAPVAKATIGSADGSRAADSARRATSAGRGAAGRRQRASAHPIVLDSPDSSKLQGARPQMSRWHNPCNNANCLGGQCAIHKRKHQSVEAQCYCQLPWMPGTPRARSTRCLAFPALHVQLKVFRMPSRPWRGSAAAAKAKAVQGRVPSGSPLRRRQGAERDALRGTAWKPRRTAMRSRSRRCS